MSTQVKASHILVETEDEAKKIYEEISNGKNPDGKWAVRVFFFPEKVISASAYFVCN